MLQKQKRIPSPEEFLLETPLPAALQKIKAERDREIRAVITGESEKMLVTRSFGIKTFKRICE